MALQNDLSEGVFREFPTKKAMTGALAAAVSFNVYSLDTVTNGEDFFYGSPATLVESRITFLENERNENCSRSAEVVSTSVRKEILRLRTETRFTMDQLARALGVSRRTVHNWASGGAINSVHIEKLSRFSDLVAEYKQPTPDATRIALLSSTSGLSPFQRFLEEEVGRKTIQI